MLQSIYYRASHIILDYLEALTPKNVHIILEKPIISQGTNARKVIPEVYAFFVLQHVLSLDGTVNTRRMSQPDLESIFTKIINEIFQSKKTIMWIFKIFKIQCFYPPRILNEHWCIYSCLQIPPRENWFQYVRRVCATAINFPCINTMVFYNFLKWSFFSIFLINLKMAIITI